MLQKQFLTISLWVYVMQYLQSTDSIILIEIFVHDYDNITT